MVITKQIIVITRNCFRWHFITQTCFRYASNINVVYIQHSPKVVSLLNKLLTLAKNIEGRNHL